MPGIVRMRSSTLVAAARSASMSADCSENWYWLREEKPPTEIDCTGWKKTSMPGTSAEAGAGGRSPRSALAVRAGLSRRVMKKRPALAEELAPAPPTVEVM